MYTLIGTETTGPDIGKHQILELVVLTTTDAFEIKNVSPTYVLHRTPGSLITKEAYEAYSSNKLLEECAISSINPMKAEHSLIERFGRHNRNMLNATTIYADSAAELHVKHAMPEFYNSIGRKTVYYDTVLPAEWDSKFAKSNRALETVLVMLSNIKKLVNTCNLTLN
jgi:oligoribonuclease (3'-5' exoribonuclease)